MKAIVSGATGFIGKNLVNCLLEKEYDVIVLTRDNDDRQQEWNGKVKYILCLTQQVIELDKLCDERNIDVFFQLAWHGTAGELRKDYDVQLANVKYCCDSVIGASKIGCKRFVYAGSIMEYEAIQHITEQGSAPALTNIYSSSKLTADFLTKIICNSINMEYVGLIISNIYGEGEKSPRFLNTIVRKMMNNETIDMTHGNQLYDFIYMADAVREIVLCAEKGIANHSYYIGNSVQKPLKEFVLEAKKILKSDSVINFGAVELTGAMLTYKEFDTEKVERELGYIPRVSFEQGIRCLKRAIERE